ncbi:hypothetical protein [Curtobacterium sp. MCBA15_001]|uniref:hypothetical protein n=1 Tax=Curtobacterium sp. MCBA15_001 TaxID=1898731 RepID=UPI0008DCD8B5|nr:hypothetical protein [Curtobacterium sp. MCBA15_001]OIH97912.1 hypothetical protein BIU90_12895 [Curtobacterium sp. MCBA15_001]
MTDTSGEAKKQEVVQLLRGDGFGYRLTIPMDSLAPAQDIARAAEMSFHVIALVNHVTNADRADQRLSFAGSSVEYARVLRAGYGSPFWMDVIQALKAGGWVVGIAAGVKLIASAVESLAVLPAKIQRPYLENRKLDAETRKLEAEIRELEQALHQEQGRGADEDGDEENLNESGPVLAHIGTEGPVPELAPGIGTGGVMDACDWLLDSAQDDGSPEYSVWEATLRRARRDAEQGRTTNEVQAIGYLFRFAGSDGRITERDDEAA